VLSYAEWGLKDGASQGAQNIMSTSDPNTVKCAIVKVFQQLIKRTLTLHGGICDLESLQ
jgi:hypothetical protein